MASLERFTLRWDNFQANARATLKEFRGKEELFDVTLVAGDGKQAQANKVVLAAGSTFFHKILEENPHQHPSIYLHGVDYKHLTNLLDFLYTGVAIIANEDTNDFLHIARDLKIKGLTSSTTSIASAFRTLTSYSAPIATPALQSGAFATTASLSADCTISGPQSGTYATSAPQTKKSQTYLHLGDIFPHPTSGEKHDLTGHVKVEVDITNDYNDFSHPGNILPYPNCEEKHDLTGHVKVEVDNTNDYNDFSHPGNILPHPTTTSEENPDLIGHVKVEVDDTNDYNVYSSHPGNNFPPPTSENCDLFSKVKLEVEIDNANTHNNNEYNTSYGKYDEGNEESTHDWYDQGEEQEEDYGMVLDSEQSHNEKEISVKKEFECLTCHKLFSKLSYLKKHKRIHTGEKRHQCLSCDKKFLRLFELNQHNRIHTGEKPYQCLMCDKKFTQWKSLNNHIGVHTGEKYECLTCHKKFSRKDNLARHMRSHTG